LVLKISLELRNKYLQKDVFLWHISPSVYDVVVVTVKLQVDMEMVLQSVGVTCLAHAVADHYRNNNPYLLHGMLDPAVHQ